MATYTLTASQLQGAGISNVFDIPDANAQAYLTATGISDTLQQNIIAELVQDLKNYGIWSKMKAVYPFVTDNRNLLSYTEDFGNAAWTKSDISTTTNTTTAPNGTLTADKLTPNTTNIGHWVRQSISLTSGITQTATIYAKADGYNFMYLYANGSGSGQYRVFDLQNGTLGVSGGTQTASIENVGNGWYRCVLTWTPSTTTSANLEIAVLSTNSIAAFAGDGTSGIFLWGAQLELGSTATTYQPIATTQQAYISNQFKYNLVNPVDSDAAFRLVFNGGWTFDSTGATPNGTNGYADTFYSPSLNSTITNNHFMLYLPSVSIPSVITTDLGALSADYNSRFQTNYFQNPSLDTTNFDVRKRTSVSNSLIGSGCVIYSRSAINSAKVYFNNSIVANDTSNTLTYALPNITVYLAAGHLGTTAITYSNRRNCFTSLGDGLTDTEAANLYTAVQAFQTKLSRQV